MPHSKKRKIIFADAFAGCGGLSLGLMQAGLEGRFAIEHDKFAFETLSANLLSKDSKFKFVWPRWLPKEPIAVATLLRDYKAELQSLGGKIDLLVGGPPCQGFSCAGRRKHDDPRNKLFASYLRIVDSLRPKAVLIENVRGFTMDFEPDASVRNYSTKLRKKLSARYDVFERLIDLSQFGVPQRRTRYFLLALEPGLCERDPFDLLIERLPSFLRSLRLKTPVSSWAAISDLEISLGGKQPSTLAVDIPYGIYRIEGRLPWYYSDTKFVRVYQPLVTVVLGLRFSQELPKVPPTLRGHVTGVPVSTTKAFVKLIGVYEHVSVESLIEGDGTFSLGGLSPGAFLLLVVGEHGIVASRTLTIPYTGPPLEIAIKEEP
jgi:site-specific DNA-cytosine methylase